MIKVGSFRKYWDRETNAAAIQLELYGDSDSGIDSRCPRQVIGGVRIKQSIRHEPSSSHPLQEKNGETCTRTHQTDAGTKLKLELLLGHGDVMRAGTSRRSFSTADENEQHRQ